MGLEKVWSGRAAAHTAGISGSPRMSPCTTSQCPVKGPAPGSRPVFVLWPFLGRKGWVLIVCRIFLTASHSSQSQWRVIRALSALWGATLLFTPFNVLNATSWATVPFTEINVELSIRNWLQVAKAFFQGRVTFFLSCHSFQLLLSFLKCNYI